MRNRNSQNVKQKSSVSLCLSLSTTIRTLTHPKYPKRQWRRFASKDRKSFKLISARENKTHIETRDQIRQKQTEKLSDSQDMIAISGNASSAVKTKTLCILSARFVCCVTFQNANKNFSKRKTFTSKKHAQKYNQTNIRFKINWNWRSTIPMAMGM